MQSDNSDVVLDPEKFAFAINLKDCSRGLEQLDTYKYLVELASSPNSFSAIFNFRLKSWTSVSDRLQDPFYPRDAGLHCPDRFKTLRIEP